MHGETLKFNSSGFSHDSFILIHPIVLYHIE